MNEWMRRRRKKNVGVKDGEGGRTTFPFGLILKKSAPEAVLWSPRLTCSASMETPAMYAAMKDAAPHDVGV